MNKGKLKYYTGLLNVSLVEREDLKARLDALSAPFSENVAYHAFLEMERLATGLGRSKLSGED